MLKSYKYLDSEHCKLHKFIMAFFARIENETGDFSLDFFEPEFRKVADRHRKILKNRCKEIYEIVKTWKLEDRKKFCQQIIDSNDIESICKGIKKPVLITEIPEEIRVQVKELFDALYLQVLNSHIFNEEFDTTLRKHFDEFRTLNDEITLCPICGISELKTKFDSVRDQYDHYLPKSIYPFSSVNFNNLIPACTDCNSLEVKGDKDIVKIASNSKLFYIYDQNHKGIFINLRITKDAKNIENLEWELKFSNPDGKVDEINSWREIYNIDSRYLGFINGRLKKWARIYLKIKNSHTLNKLTESEKEKHYNEILEADETEFINFLRKPALNAFIRDSVLLKAEIEMKSYS